MNWPCTEELPEVMVNRRIAGALVLLLRRTPVTPNMITMLSMVTGVGGGVLLALGKLPGAATCILGAIVLDCADGQLARANGRGTELGRILDGVADYVVGAAVHVGMLLHFLRFPIGFIDSPWKAVVVTLVSAIGMLFHSVLLDGHKNYYLGRDITPRTNRGLFGSLYRGYARTQRMLLGTNRPSAGYVRAMAVFGPTTRLWMIAAMAIHPYAALGALVADVYFLVIACLGVRFGSEKAPAPSTDTT